MIKFLSTPYAQFMLCAVVITETIGLITLILKVILYAIKGKKQEMEEKTKDKKFTYNYEEGQ